MSHKEWMLNLLEQEILPLVGKVRGALSEMMAAPDQNAVSRFLAAAPVEACVRLADTWAQAQSIGLPTERVKERFGPEDQFLIEIVASVYTAARPMNMSHFADLPDWLHLINEPHHSSAPQVTP